MAQANKQRRRVLNKAEGVAVQTKTPGLRSAGRERRVCLVTGMTKNNSRVPRTTLRVERFLSLDLPCPEPVQLRYSIRLRQGPVSHSQTEHHDTSTTRKNDDQTHCQRGEVVSRLRWEGRSRAVQHLSSGAIVSRL